MNFYRAALYTAGVMFLCSLTLLCVETMRTERAIVANVEALRTEANDDALHFERDIVAVGDRVLELVDNHLRKIEGEVHGAVVKADGQLGNANRSIAAFTNAAASTLPVLGNSVSQAAAAIAQDVHGVTAPAAAIANQVNDQAPLFLDCSYNPDCAFNRFQGTSKAIERTAQAWALAAPDLAHDASRIEGHVDHITAAIEKEADALTKPKKWYQRALGWAELAGFTALKVF
jgi:hypothetical protein